MSQLTRYSRACNSYQDVLHGSVLLTRKFLNQGFIETRLRSTLKKLCGAAGNTYPSIIPNFISGVYSGSHCPVICVSLFHVIILSFEFWLFRLFDCVVFLYILLSTYFTREISIIPERKVQGYRITTAWR